MKLPCAFLFIAASALAPACAAQTMLNVNADSSSHEIEYFAGGGLGTDGVGTHVPNWNLGVRYGWMLTDRPSNRFYSTRFEYAMDIVPVFMNFQRNGPSHGVEFDPVVLKWNATPHGRLQPFLELSFGISESNIRIPPDTSRFNFTPNGTVGVRILRGRYDWSIGIRYFHFSNAHLLPNNPGDNSVGVRIALCKWLK